MPPDCNSLVSSSLTKYYSSVFASQQSKGVETLANTSSFKQKNGKLFLTHLINKTQTRVRARAHTHTHARNHARTHTDRNYT